jgi:uncharacterized protein YutE (UPF0331/DUF86 family)
MANLPDKIAAEKENIEMALSNLQTALDKKSKSPLEIAGMATFLHNIYNGIENILMQILKSKNIKVDRAEEWHKKLLNISVFHGILTEELADKLYAYLTFRHFFIHAYGFMLDETELIELATNIYPVWSEFLAAIAPYLCNGDI